MKRRDPGRGADREDREGDREREGDRNREPDPNREPDRVDHDPAHDPDAPVICEVCGAEMYYTAACKLQCPRCGYTRDCSDP